MCVNAWYLNNSTLVYDVHEVHVCLYLKSLEAKGPTAARGGYTQLRWLELNVGCFFHTDSRDVKERGAVHSDHIERQVPPMKIVWWIKLELMTSSSNQFVRALSLTWCAIIVCVLRFAHIQRCHVTALTDRSWEVHCSRNKVKTMGKCRPFYARGPRIGITGTDLGALFNSFQKYKMDVLQINGMFFLPDFGPDKKDLHEISAWRTTKMSQAKFVRLSKQMFMVAGFNIPPEVIHAALKSTYKGRRLLPTACNMIGMSTKEAISIGGWRDADGSMVKEARRLAMPTRYADQELESSALLKQEVVTSCRIAWNRVVQQVTQGVGASSDVPFSPELKTANVPDWINKAHMQFEDFDWHEIRKFLPSRKQSKALMLEEAYSRSGGDKSYKPRGKILASFEVPKAVSESPNVGPSFEVSSSDLSGRRSWPNDPKRGFYPFEGPDSFLSFFKDRAKALEAWEESKIEKELWAPDKSDSDTDNAEDTDSDSSVELDQESKSRIIAVDGPESLQWYLPLSAGSRLHVKSEAREGAYCFCKRTLTRAEEGIGLGAAFATGRKWSPRCFQFIQDNNLEAEWVKHNRDNPCWNSDSESDTSE